MKGQIVGYVRVSSTSQHIDRQVEAIGPVDEMFTDRVSGGNRQDRAELARMLRHVRNDDVLRVASMDRLARSLVDLEQLVEELTGRGVTIEFLKERLTFAPGDDDGFAIFQRQLIGAVAQLERNLIRERQREGIDLARKRGAYKGRARKLDDEQVRHVKSAVASGESKAKIARDLGCSRRVLYEVLGGRGAYAPVLADTPVVVTRPPMAGGAQEVELPL
jgi:DNA invertase Pin-like site-specific DNA recombinase